MKFTVIFVTLLSVTWAVKVKEDPKDKREAPVGYYGGGQSSHSFQSPSFGHGDANAVSIGAGYSIGGGKPSFVYGAPEGGHGLQLSSASSEGLPSSGHATIQLQPITLQPSHGNLASSDLNQLMKELSQGLNSGSLQLSPYQDEGHNAQGGQEYAIQQYSLGEPKQQQYTLQAEQAYASIPSYASGTKGLGSYGSTGPVLFTPSLEGHGGEQPTLTYGAPGGDGHSFDANAFSQAGSLAGLSFGEGGHGFSAAGHGHSLGGSGFGGHSLAGSGLGGHSLGGSGPSGHSLGGSGLSSHSLGGSGLSGHSLGGLSLGSSGHSFGGSLKSFGGGYVLPGKTSFKPSTYLGSHGDSGHSLSGLSGSHGAPSFASHSLSGGHGGLSLSSGGHGHGPSFVGSSHGSFGGGSSKFVAQAYLPPKSKGFGSSLDSASAFSSSSHASPPRTTYGIPAGSFSGSSGSSIHSAASHSPKYYVSSSKFPSFEGSSYKASSSSHGSPSSFSSGGPKYSFGSRSSPSSHYGAPKDVEGSYSENSYNTIKYSEELKPRN